MDSDDERLGELLRSLSRESASRGFTAGVLARLRQDEQRRRRFFGLPLERAVLAAALVFLALAGGLLMRQKMADAARHEALARIETLEAQRDALEAELLALQRDARDAQGVIYLGSTPDYDMVLDMSRLARRRAENTIRPAMAAPQHNQPQNVYFR